MKKISLIILIAIVLTVDTFSQGVKISSSPGTPHPSSILDIESVSQGFLPPRMTTIERDGIQNPTNGLHIFNTSTGCPEYYNNGLWFSMCGSCPPPATPVSGIHSTSENQIVWNWGAVSGALGYKWALTNNYASANDLGNLTTYTQIELTCGTPVTIYVWAYSGCGASANAVELNESTTVCPWSCGMTFDINHVAGEVSPVNKIVTYGTVSTSITGTPKCWITQNLGADQQATSALDATEASAGWYWQFNRKQGYKHDGVTRIPGTAWISTISETSVWLPSQDPCAITLGSGWRIPTATEWSNADSNGGWSNETNAFASVLKLHAGGGIVFDTDGSYGLGGYYTSFWSSSENDTNTAYRLKLLTGECIVDNTRNKSHGFHLRCLKD